MKCCDWDCRITELYKSQLCYKSPYCNLLHLVFQSHIEEQEDSIPEPPLPPMRMDVLGLKHDEIMNKVCHKYC
jgi:hypothetical protein